MMTLIAAALAAAAPAPSAPDAHEQAMHSGDMAEHKKGEGCDCCKDMADKHEGQAPEHEGHAGSHAGK